MVEHGPNGAPGAAIALRTLSETKRTVDKESFRTLSKAEHADRDVLAFRIQQGVPISSRSMFFDGSTQEFRNQELRKSGIPNLQAIRPKPNFEAFVRLVAQALTCPWACRPGE